MSLALKSPPMSLSAAEIETLRARLPRAFSADPAEAWKRRLVWGAAAALTIYCLYRFGSNY